MVWAAFWIVRDPQMVAAFGHDALATGSDSQIEGLVLAEGRRPTKYRALIDGLQTPGVRACQVFRVDYEPVGMVINARRVGIRELHPSELRLPAIGGGPMDRRRAHPEYFIGRAGP
jgi:hypothetical protein